jgi:hypothetical protein
MSVPCAATALLTAAHASGQARRPIARPAELRDILSDSNLRFFVGLSVEEAADVLHLSTDTIKRGWRLAKRWLLREWEGDAR